MESEKSRSILITGGAGFIGSNLAASLLRQPRARIRVFDNLSRAGMVHNLEWLQSIAPRGRLEFVPGDVRDFTSLAEAARDATEIYHLAAQVAVTTSLDDPTLDFEVNARGTLNMLEAARQSGKRPFVLFTSTNKVYGALESLAVTADKTRYCAGDHGFKGINENQPLDFHSPYGCSKGAADQYVRDYARIYGLRTAVLRMSCIAGPRQFGNEDQGWVAHFLYSALEQKPVTVYGNGLQVRDVLHVDDLIAAMTAIAGAGKTMGGQVFNLGGGLTRSASVLEMLGLVEEKTGHSVVRHQLPVRPGDQALYIADTARLHARTGWQPRKTLAETIEDIYQFWLSNRTKIAQVRHPVTPPLVSEEVA